MREFWKFIGAVIVLGAALIAAMFVPDKALSDDEVIPVVVGNPVHISIPSIGVDADIESVGKIEDGKMGVPFIPMNVGWYKHGPRPGELGSAVMDGHVNWFGGMDAVFTNLHTIQIGDEIFIVDDGGIQRIFVVERLERYRPHDDAREIFKSHDDLVRLNLITCDGPWDDVMKTHSFRLVVFAVEK
ncbi:MAG: class F sortase [Candidatus Pacebacteria bacterium]|nr:class F sortase [Candidatus Paceibacterota bacterium]